MRREKAEGLQTQEKSQEVRAPPPQKQDPAPNSHKHINPSESGDGSPLVHDVSFVEETPVFMEMEGLLTQETSPSSPLEEYQQGANGLEPKPPDPSSKHLEEGIESMQEDYSQEGVDPSLNHEASIDAMQA